MKLMKLALLMAMPAFAFGCSDDDTDDSEDTEDTSESEDSDDSDSDDSDSDDSDSDDSDSDDSDSDDSDSDDSASDSDTGVANVVTIEDIRDGSVTENTDVTIEDLVVTASTSLGYFAQDGAVTKGGIYIFTGSSGNKPAVGTKVDVTGEYKDYFGLAQIDVVSGSVVEDGTDTVPTPVVVTLATLQDDNAADAYESMLIKVADSGMAVTEVNSSYGEWTFGAGGDTVLADDLIYDALDELSIAVGQTLDSCSGPLYYAYSKWRVLPRDAADVENLQTPAP